MQTPSTVITSRGTHQQNFTVWVPFEAHRLSVPDLLTQYSKALRDLKRQ
jgi:hypothetical protein